MLTRHVLNNVEGGQTAVVEAQSAPSHLEEVQAPPALPEEVQHEICDVKWHCLEEFYGLSCVSKAFKSMTQSVALSDDQCAELTLLRQLAANCPGGKLSRRDEYYQSKDTTDGKPTEESYSEFERERAQRCAAELARLSYFSADDREYWENEAALMHGLFLPSISPHRFPA